MTSFFRMRDQVSVFYHTQGPGGLASSICTTYKENLFSAGEYSYADVEQQADCFKQGLPLGIAEWFRVHHNGGVGFAGN